MNSKQITGVAAGVVGILLIVFSVYSMRPVSPVKAVTHGVSDFFSNHSIGSMAKGAVHGKAGTHDTPAFICLIGGIFLVVVGGGMVYMFRKKRWMRK